MYDNKCKYSNRKYYQQLFPVMRYGAWPLVCDGGDKFFICTLMTFSAGYQFVLPKTGDSGSFFDRMSWAVWQLEHTGAFVCPRKSFLP